MKDWEGDKGNRPWKKLACHSKCSLKSTLVESKMDHPYKMLVFLLLSSLLVPLWLHYWSSHGG